MCHTPVCLGNGVLLRGATNGRSELLNRDKLLYFCTVVLKVTFSGATLS